MAAVAASFASVIALLAEFVNQRRAGAALKYEEFRAWLADNQHHEVMQLLDLNTNAVVSIKVLFLQGQTANIERFDRLDRAVAMVASNIGGLADLAAAIRPEARLSDAAIEFLRAFERCGSGEVLEIIGHQRRLLVPIQGDRPNQPEIDYGDWRFFEDDMATLIETGLLRQKHANGKRIFVLTRAALDFLHSLS